MANRGSGTISVIDVRTDQVVGTYALPAGPNPPEPMYVFYNPKHSRLFVGDRSNNRMGAKIAVAREQQIPYMLIAGDRDAAANAVSVRLRTDEDRGQIPVDDFVAHIRKIVSEKSLEL